MLIKSVFASLDVVIKVDLTGLDGILIINNKQVPSVENTFDACLFYKDLIFEEIPNVNIEFKRNIGIIFKFKNISQNELFFYGCRLTRELMVEACFAVYKDYQHMFKITDTYTDLTSGVFSDLIVKVEEYYKPLALKELDKFLSTGKVFLIQEKNINFIRYSMIPEENIMHVITDNKHYILIKEDADKKNSVYKDANVFLQDNRIHRFKIINDKYEILRISNTDGKKAIFRLFSPFDKIRLIGRDKQGNNASWIHGKSFTYSLKSLYSKPPIYYKI